MTKCPHCNADLNYDFLDDVMNKLGTSPMRNELYLFSPCCYKELHAIAEFGMYYIHSEPMRAEEHRTMIGAC